MHLRGGLRVPRLALVVGWPPVVVGGGLVFAHAHQFAVATGLALVVTGVTILARSVHRPPAVDPPTTAEH